MATKKTNTFICFEYGERPITGYIDGKHGPSPTYGARGIKIGKIPLLIFILNMKSLNFNGETITLEYDGKAHGIRVDDIWIEELSPNEEPHRPEVENKDAKAAIDAGATSEPGSGQGWAAVLKAEKEETDRKNAELQRQLKELLDRVQASEDRAAAAEKDAEKAKKAAEKANADADKAKEAAKKAKEDLTAAKGKK